MASQRYARLRRAQPGRTVGRVAAIWRYPVKSMAAEPVAEAEVSWHGLAGDRRWALLRDGVPHSGFPWLTLRQRADLARFRPSFVRPERPDTSVTAVRTPTGEEFDAVDPALAAGIGDGLRMIKQDRGVFDTLPLSLITTQSITGLGGLVETPLASLRFRPNLLIEAYSEEPFPEDEWVGRVLRIGGMRMRVDKRNRRCAIINIDPATTDRDPSVLRTLARQRELWLGVYGSTVAPGRIAVGDPVVFAVR